MQGRDTKMNNDVFFVCSLVEHIARLTHNHRSVVVNAIGKDRLQHIFDLADVYHSDNIDKIADELIESAAIEQGYFDNVAESKYSIPSFWDIGKVYCRLIIGVYQHRGSSDLIGVLMEVYNSWIGRKLEDLNCSLYYENPDYIFQSFLHGDVLP
jgi:hypothetical protein